LLCKKCGLDAEHLIWDYEYNTNTGKWRLFDRNMERPHECISKTVKPPTPKPQEKPVICPHCDPLSKNKFIKRENFQTTHQGRTFRFLVILGIFGTKKDTFY